MHNAPTKLIAPLLAILALASAGVHAQDEEILRPEQAFPYTLSADADRLSLSFSIPEGYYLYRERFSFESGTDGIVVDTPGFPVGEIHEDEFFGRQEIYRHDFLITIPYSRTGAAESMELDLELQGCADIGLCYPPQRWTRAVDLPPAPFELGREAATGFLGGPPSDEPLAPEDAFEMNARFDGANELTVSFQIEPGYYLYNDKFEFTVVGDIQLGSPKLPEGVEHYDQNFGDVRVHYDYVEAVIPFSRATPDEIPVTIQAVFQGCKEDSICYPPMERFMSLSVPAATEFASGTSTSPTAPAAQISEQDSLARLIISGSWPIVLGTFFLLGLGLSFTPCVLPMIPILSSIIAGHGQVSTGKGFALSLSYVMGMAVTYTAAGALASMAGEQVQAIFQQTWIIMLFAGLFAVLSLGMFGLYELQMPTAIQSRVAALANRQKSGSFIGTAIMGALSALIVTACVAPPLIATLIAMGRSGDVVRGSAALFALSIGMGVPLLVVGASAGSILPKAGPWMNAVKAAFGIMMLGVAIWMLERVLPGAITLLLWSLLVFLTGVFLGAFDPLPENPASSRRLAKGVGVLACLYGALMLIGATLGGEDPLRPLPRDGLFASGAEAAEGLEFRNIETLAALETALAEARAAGSPVMIDFTADWCVSCREMEEYTFPDAGVIAALEPFLLLRADVTANNDDDQDLLKYFNSYGPPTIAFFDSSGQAQDPYKLVGYVPADDFAAHVSRVAAL